MKALEKWECVDFDCNGSFLVDHISVKETQELICPYCGGKSESVVGPTKEDEFDSALSGCLWPQGPEQVIGKGIPEVNR